MKLLYIGALIAASATAALGQGSLTPPGPPGPTMKTLDQIQARIAITSIPFPISAPGSYYLAIQPTAVTSGTAITIAADNVSLDLNGFTLVGAAGSESGISVSGARRDVRVFNGIVRGFGANGVDLASAVFTEIYSLISASNGGVGINGGDTATIRDCVSRDNNGDNFRAGAHAVISRCTAVLSATGHGFNVTDDAQISNCVADSNRRGFTGLDGVSLSYCVARRNKDYGIYTENASVISNCSASGQTSQNNSLGIGIRAADDAMISGCTSSRNAGDGLQVIGSSQIFNNNASENGNATAHTGSGIHLFGGRNRVDGNVTNGNQLGIQAEDISDTNDKGFNVVVRNVSIGNGIPYPPLNSSHYYGPTNQQPSTATSPWANF